MHLYTVKGQQDEYARLNKPIKEDGWYVIPGKIDNASYGLLIMFALSILFLYLLNSWADDAQMLTTFAKISMWLIVSAVGLYLAKEVWQALKRKSKLSITS